MATNKYIIIRKDLDADRVTLETEGLTIGRLTGNDLVLNHPTVSRTHAGVKAVNDDYWIFNLSKANGTLLNGALVDRSPLADDDVIQIGPFLLRATYTDDDLALEVEMSVKPLPISEHRTGALQRPGERGGTSMMEPGLLAQREKLTPRRTGRLSSTGMLTGLLPAPEEQVLRIFWDKRKREAGKLDVKSLLRPRGRQQLGKAQSYWRPTSDLQRSWRPALFLWGAVIITALAVLAAFTYEDAYSPGILSAAHARSEFAFTPPIANDLNSASCTACHSRKASIWLNCASCHTTQAFEPSISDKHRAVGLTCGACHSEHKGREFRPALVASSGCKSCHRDGMVSYGRNLRTPHGGTLGYPVLDGEWRWAGVAQAEWRRKGLPGSELNYNLREQFHLVHIAGRRQGRAKCSDCHTAGLVGETLRQGVRESCANCHAVDYQVASTKEAGAGCVACHAQHGEEKGLKASLRRLESVE